MHIALDIHMIENIVEVIYNNPMKFYGICSDDDDDDDDDDDHYRRCVSALDH